MKSERFRTAPIPMTLDGPNIVEDTPKEFLDRTEGENLYRVKQDKGYSQVSAYVDELPIKLFNADGTTTTEYVKVIIGDENSSLILLSNGKLYFADGDNINLLKFDQELNPVQINLMIKLAQDLLTSVGSLTKLITGKKTSIVEAINETYAKAVSSRCLIGYAPFLLMDAECRKEIIPADLSKGFDMKEQRWLYYSVADEQWVYLPLGWEKAKYLARHLEDLETVKPNLGDFCGFLEEDRVLVWNGEFWAAHEDLKTMVGDEYIVQTVFGGGHHGEIGGSVVYTPMGWTSLTTK